MVNSYDHFCNLFIRSRVPDRRVVPKKLELYLGDILSHGKIDILLQYSEDSYLLVDFKLKKFGMYTESLEFFELLQLLLYYNELKRRNFNIQAVAYYFFEEREFLLESTSNPPFSNSEEIIQHIINSLLRTYFKPTKCALCLICPLKTSCVVGSKLSSNDFDEPLMPLSSSLTPRQVCV